MQEIRIQFETIANVKLETGSVSLIVVPDNGILGSRDAGAEILITLHTCTSETARLSSNGDQQWVGQA